MQIILPVTVTDGILTSSTVSENDYEGWDSNTIYSIGDRVILVSTHKIYESLVNSNGGNNPATDDGTNWLELSATNRWKAFDQKISEKVSQANSIGYTFEPTGEIVNALAFFGLDAVELTVVMTDDVEGEFYNETFSLTDNSYVIDWFSYFFEPTRYLDEKVITGIPPYTGPTIEITISEIGSTAEVGQIVFGRALNLGLTQYGTTVSIEDYSRKERDTFGNPIILQRAFSQRAEYDFSLETSAIRRVQSALAGIRTTPVVWSLGGGTSQFGTTIYGFYKDFSINISGPTLSYGTIEVEGLT